MRFDLKLAAVFALAATALVVPLSACGAKSSAVTSAPSGPARTILPDTTGRFGLIQIIDDYGHADDASILGSLSGSQIQTEAPHYDSVWASFNPRAWNASHRGMIVSRYTIPNEDNELISGRDLSWWQKNHPDWVLYACDGRGNPIRASPWSGVGFSDVPLDIHNPAVVSYQAYRLGNYMIAHGYNALAVDNVTFANYMRAPNPVLGQGKPQTGWYACGIYADGIGSCVATVPREAAISASRIRLGSAISWTGSRPRAKSSIPIPHWRPSSEDRGQSPHFGRHAGR